MVKEVKVVIPPSFEAQERCQFYEIVSQTDSKGNRSMVCNGFFRNVSEQKGCTKTRSEPVAIFNDTKLHPL